MPCYSPLKGYKDADSGGWTGKRTARSFEPMEVACGQCLGCRLDRSRSWAMRCLHESSLHNIDGIPANCFITLTYRSKEECNAKQLLKGYHVPDDWSLSGAHLAKFWKRLRKVTPQKIKYFACGEYGERCEHLIPGDGRTVKDCDCCNVGRPHYHAIVFNRVFADAEHIGTTSSGEPLLTSPELERIWKYGNVQVTNEVNFQTAAYVARYVLKKRNGALADEHYFKVDGGYWVEPEFVRMSNGIGKGWYEKFKDDIFPSDEVPIPDPSDPKVVKKVPRYYEEALRKVDPDLYEQIKERRVQYRSENKEEYSPGRLMAKYKVKKAATKIFMERS